MFGHRSFLRIGSLDDASIKGLLASGMELNSFSYSYNQAIDIRGKAQGEVRSGILLLTFANLPPDEIIASDVEAVRDNTYVAPHPQLLEIGKSRDSISKSFDKFEKY